MFFYGTISYLDTFALHQDKEKAMQEVSHNYRKKIYIRHVCFIEPKSLIEKCFLKLKVQRHELTFILMYSTNSLPK